ncbi:MAG TPA: class I SAM-dependent methyltransferase, partial [Thermoanaerobaculia bacterium]|nr:class I SAM-dependent methyltransferase [Thermoanaerobaculia bacterium]
RVTNRTAEEWEALARDEPYFGILTDGGDVDVRASSSASAEFFRTGEEDIAALLAAITSVVGRKLPLRAVLDFGCGAGRLTIPLARRAANVVACDVAPTMLLHARRNAEAEGLQNVTYLLADEAVRLPHGSFDFICSLLVLQYVAPAAGYPLIAELTRLLAPGGVAALHMMLARAGGDPRAENAYDERRVQRSVAAAGGRLVSRLPLGAGDVLLIDQPAGRTFEA